MIWLNYLVRNKGMHWDYFLVLTVDAEETFSTPKMAKGGNDCLVGKRNLRRLRQITPTER
jgi:hypothetical protein